jgi:hypothetical protein
MMGGMPLHGLGPNLKRAMGKQRLYPSFLDKWKRKPDVRMVLITTIDVARTVQGGRSEPFCLVGFRGNTVHFLEKAGANFIRPLKISHSPPREFPK